MDKFAKQALAEYNGDTKTVRHGGQNGKNFWNMHSSQFMYVPAFEFPRFPYALEYIFTATDCNGEKHSFTDSKSTSPLTPIWKDIPEGMVELKVEARHANSDKPYVVGTRTFFKCAPFPGREALPERACSYKESATRAFRFAYQDPASQYWLEHGKPDPNYVHNVYPSKTFSSLVRAMISYAQLEPENAEKALQLAKNAADYLLDITYGDEYALAGLPPTYYAEGLDKKLVTDIAGAAIERCNQVMMFYPADAGGMYLALEEATGDKKYFDAACRIAEYYKKSVLPNGSWPLLVTVDTNEAESTNCCLAFEILDFLNAMHRRTGEACWHELEKNYFSYIRKTCLDSWNWEGQFEDAALTGGYYNLSHWYADCMVAYIVKNFADDSEMIKEAEELMRFIEDQFVVWGKFAPWGFRYKEGVSQWFSPAGLEQYSWYIPIDASTAAIAGAFMDLYSVTHEELLLEKACALCDSITRMQNPETGEIPTHWTDTLLTNFWLNCHVLSANTLMRLAKVTGEI